MNFKIDENLPAECATLLLAGRVLITLDLDYPGVPSGNPADS
ncbi:MAG TPA: hypothetical protein VN893_06600 [Bryobacteraceae bacterium]|nr:hypothetical protein [Bryobacteraceae bacterium]